jgi:hypothetical protein
MTKGFLWFAQNTESIDYVNLSIELAQSIKKHNKENAICVVVDKKSHFQSQYVDQVIVLDKDDSKEQDIKFANEHKAFELSPFTHTIKLEADMLFTSSTDWWWYYLCQNDLVFSVNCRNYEDKIVKDTTYRALFHYNHLPNIYNGLTYFRKSQRAMQFFKICKSITENWKMVQEQLLINCHDRYPSTDVVYALAYRILDPLNESLIDYPWFKFIHGKNGINSVPTSLDQYNYLYPIKLHDRIYIGGNRLHRIWHYHDKKIPEVLNGRVF